MSRFALRRTWGSVMASLRLCWLSCAAAALLVAGAFTTPAISSSQNAGLSPDALPPTTASACSANTIVAEVPLRVEQFESGELKLPDVYPHQLVVFLRDLNRRRDYDYSQHSERPGPNYEYLTRWIHEVTKVLMYRGYSFDSAGEFHAPDGSLLPTR